jgi:hypothetical protein
MSDIPRHMAGSFQTVFIPLIRDFASTLEPWANPTNQDILKFIARVWKDGPKMDMTDDLFIIIQKVVSFLPHASLMHH